MAFYNADCPRIAVSLPSRGAWIEMQHLAADQRILHVAPLAGSVDRNLRRGRSRERVPAVAPLAGSVDRNQDMQRSNYIGRRSLPSRGAWIEIVPCRVYRSSDRPSLPSRGAWIEMDGVRMAYDKHMGRSPRGERG